MFQRLKTWWGLRGAKKAQRELEATCREHLEVILKNRFILPIVLEMSLEEDVWSDREFEELRVSAKPCLEGRSDRPPYGTLCVNGSDILTIDEHQEVRLVGLPDTPESWQITEIFLRKVRLELVESLRIRRIHRERWETQNLETLKRIQL